MKNKIIELIVVISLMIFNSCNTSRFNVVFQDYI
jgi:predicted small secreted protein